jgi:hypothetical protein
MSGWRGRHVLENNWTGTSVLMKEEQGGESLPLMELYLLQAIQAHIHPLDMDWPRD